MIQHSPVTAHVVVVHPHGSLFSSAFIEDILDRRRLLFVVAHDTVTDRVAKWAEENGFDQCDIQYAEMPSAPVSSARQPRGGTTG